MGFHKNRYSKAALSGEACLIAEMPKAPKAIR